MAVHHAVGISCQRNSGYRPSRVNIVAQGLSTLDPSLSPTHLSIRRGCATTTHYTDNQVSLVVSRNTTLVPSLGLRIGPACEAGLSAGMRRVRVSPQIRKEKRLVKMLKVLLHMKATFDTGRRLDMSLQICFFCPSAHFVRGLVRKTLQILFLFSAPHSSQPICSADVWSQRS